MHTTAELEGYLKGPGLGFGGFRGFRGLGVRGLGFRDLGLRVWGFRAFGRLLKTKVLA